MNPDQRVPTTGDQISVPPVGPSGAAVPSSNAFEDLEFSTALAEARTAMLGRAQAGQTILDQVAGQVFDAYREALGSGFTAQAVINGALHGVDIESWDGVRPEIQDVLSALGAKHPQQVDRTALSQTLAASLIEHLSQHAAPATERQVELLSAAMAGVVQVLEDSGLNFGAEVRQARILGIGPLACQMQLLTSAGQFYMARDEYSVDLLMTSNAIKAQRTALAEALVAAGDVEIDCGIRVNTLKGLKEASVSVDLLSGRTTLKYSNATGEKGSLDITHAGITDLSANAFKNGAWQALTKSTDQDAASGAIFTHRHEIVASAGLADNLKDEMRGNLSRGILEQVGVDLRALPERLLVDPVRVEPVTFFYPVNRHGQNTERVVAVRFDERYGGAQLFVQSRQALEESVQRASHMEELLADGSYKADLPSISVHDYLKAGARLTRSNP